MKGNPLHACQRVDLYVNYDCVKRGIPSAGAVEARCFLQQEDLNTSFSRVFSAVLYSAPVRPLWISSRSLPLRINCAHAMRMRGLQSAKIHQISL